MSEPLLPARFLFRFATPCLYRSPLWTARGAALPESHRLIRLAELEGQADWADIRAAWSEEGLAFAVEVGGKTQPPWCRANRPEDSDGLHVWIDARNVHNVHRAGRFCHRFAFLPSGAGRRFDQPSAHVLPIARAKELPNPVSPDLLKVFGRNRADGYSLQAFIPAAALTGFDPVEHPRLGFAYAVIDRERGEQTFGPGGPMPYQEDPSLWATLELTGRETA